MRRKEMLLGQGKVDTVHTCARTTFVCIATTTVTMRKLCACRLRTCKHALRRNSILTHTLTQCRRFAYTLATLSFSFTIQSSP